MSTAWLPFLLVSLLVGSFALLGKRHDAAVRRVLVGCDLAVLAHYLYWRLFLSLPELKWGAGLFGYLLCLVELLLLHTRIRRRLLLRQPPRAAPSPRSSRSEAVAPRVDVFIPTYSEPVSVVTKTVVMAKRLEAGRVKVWVLDDGRRPAMREMAEAQGVRYLARSSNEHYKAGNLLNAYRHVVQSDDVPDFIVVLDADFMIKSTFLRRTLPLLDEPTVACVQTPQVFYNPDPFQFAFGAFAFWPDDQRVWFEHELPSLDANGGAMCCGTSFIVRFSALKQIGGFPTDALSEDVLMSTKLRRSGWRTVYLNEGLSLGLAPEGVKEFMTQRGRWCIGTIQVAFSEWGSIARRTGFAKLLARIDTFSWSLWTLYQVMWIVAPLLYFWFGVAVFNANDDQIVRFILPLYALRFAFSWLSGWRVVPFAQEASQLLAAPAVLRGGWQGLWARDSQKFQVTAKGTSRRAVTVQWSSLCWYGTAAGLLLMGMLRGAPGGSLGGWMFLFGGIQLFVLVVVCITCIERPKFRSDERANTDEIVSLQSSKGWVELALLDLSEGGARVRFESAVEVTPDCRLAIDGVGPVSVRLVRRIGNAELGLQLLPNAEQSVSLLVKMYDLRERSTMARQWSSLRSAASVLRRLCVG